MRYFTFAFHMILKLLGSPPLEQSHFRCSIVTCTWAEGWCECSGFYLDEAVCPGFLLCSNQDTGDWDPEAAYEGNDDLPVNTQGSGFLLAPTQVFPTRRGRLWERSHSFLCSNCLIDNGLLAAAERLWRPWDTDRFCSWWRGDLVHSPPLSVLCPHHGRQRSELKER